MYKSQAVYRELHDAVLADKGRGLYSRLLAPWSEAHAEERLWLRSFSQRRGDPIPPADDEDLCRLYALSRVSEILVLRFQRGSADGSDYPGPEISLAEYASFMMGLGLRRVGETSFSPFFHEIVEVEPAKDDDTPITAIGEFWPALMLGDMLFSRAGVLVTGGRNHTRKEIAETSELYWAYWRKNRRSMDLSKGWGSNSQWRTGLRRDYLLGGRYFFNVDGKRHLLSPAAEKDRDGLTPSERIELLIHRCFIRSADRPDQELWPYDDIYDIEAAPQEPAAR